MGGKHCLQGFLHFNDVRTCLRAPLLLIFGASWKSLKLLDKGMPTCCSRTAPHDYSVAKYLWLERYGSFCSILECNNKCLRTQPMRQGTQNHGPLYPGIDQ
ncbi:hypothetical protein XENTR_v10012160 [Xenopus tropicalis]|nr:hypothetical protein XENTR_v10012160 [Xenopus tropicalis]